MAGGRSAVRIKIGANTAQFKAAMRGVQGIVQRFGSVAKLAFAPMEALRSSIAAMSGTMLAQGMRRTIAFGAELNHLAKRAGVSAGELMVLRQAFEDAGISADSVGITLDRLTRRTYIGTQGANAYAKAFKDMGLDATSVSKMGKMDRFELVLKALASMTSETKRTAAAMDLLDTESGQFAAIWDDLPGAIADARESLGDLPAVMERTSGSFERIDTILGRLKTKVHGIFAPIIERFLPEIERAMEMLNAFDFTNIGDAIGGGIGKVVSIFKSGDMFKFLGDAIVGAFKQGVAMLGGAMKWLFSKLQLLFQWLISKLPEGMQNAIHMMLDGLSAAFTGLIKGIQSLFANALPDFISRVSTSKALRKQGHKEQRMFGQNQYADVLLDTGMDMLDMAIHRVAEKTGKSEPEIRAEFKDRRRGSVRLGEKSEWDFRAEQAQLLQNLFAKHKDLAAEFLSPVSPIDAFKGQVAGVKGKMAEGGSFEDFMAEAKATKQFKEGAANLASVSATWKQASGGHVTHAADPVAKKQLLTMMPSVKQTAEVADAVVSNFAKIGGGGNVHFAKLATPASEETAKKSHATLELIKSALESMGLHEREEPTRLIDIPGQPFEISWAKT